MTAPRCSPAWWPPRCWSRSRTRPSSARRTEATACPSPADRSEADRVFVPVWFLKGERSVRRAVSWSSSSLGFTRLYSVPLVPPQRCRPMKRWPVGQAPPFLPRATNYIFCSLIELCFFVRFLFVCIFCNIIIDLWSCLFYESLFVYIFILFYL